MEGFEYRTFLLPVVVSLSSRVEFVEHVDDEIEVMDHVFYSDSFDRMMDYHAYESRRNWLDNNWILLDELLNDVLMNDYCPSNNIDRHNVIDSNRMIIQVDEIRD